MTHAAWVKLDEQSKKREALRLRMRELKIMLLKSKIKICVLWVHMHLSHIRVTVVLRTVQLLLCFLTRDERKVFMIAIRNMPFTVKIGGWLGKIFDRG